MKIAYLSDSRLPCQSANSVHVMHVAEALGKQCHDVLLVGFWGTKQIMSRWTTDLHDHYGVERTFRIRRYFNGGFGDRNRKSRWISIAREIAREEFDFVWTRNLCAAECATRSGLPTIFEIHQPFFGPGEQHQIEMLKQLVGEESWLGVVTISRALRTFLLQKYDLPGAKMIVAPDGARKRKIPSRGEFFENSHPLRVAYIGSFFPGKGVEIVIPLALRCPDIEFTIIGGDSKSVQKVRKQYGSRRNLRLTGFLSQKEIERVKDTFDVFLLPNQPNVRVAGGNDIGAFTSPLKLFEYMAVGRPILASNLPILTEVLEHDVNAILCDPTDLSEWEFQLRRLQGDVDLRRRLGKKARVLFEENYTWEHRGEKIMRSLLDPRLNRTSPIVGDDSTTDR